MAGREQQVEQMLRSQGITVGNLKIRDGGQVISLWGTVATESDKQRAEQAIESGMQVKVANHLEPQQKAAPASAGAAGASAGGGAAAAAGARRYTVRSGDSLSKIAKEFYGDANAWKRIHAANRDKIPNPDLIHPGEELVIP